MIRVGGNGGRAEYAICIPTIDKLLTGVRNRPTPNQFVGFSALPSSPLSLALPRANRWPLAWGRLTFAHEQVALVRFGLLLVGSFCASGRGG